MRIGTGGGGEAELEKEIRRKRDGRIEGTDRVGLEGGWTTALVCLGTGKSANRDGHDRQKRLNVPDQ